MLTTPAANFATSSAGVVDTSGKFATGVNDTGGKLPPVSKTPETISSCRHLKVNSKANIYIYVNSSTQRCPNKIIKFFLLKIFFICHRCQRHRWCTLNCEYLREFSKKFETALMVYSGAWGKLIHEKNQKSKISWHCPFKGIVQLL